jgi:hypothetical protein
MKPNGIIYQCGCKNSPVIGNVDNGYETPVTGECFNSKYYKEEIKQIKEAEKLLAV